MDQQSTDTFKQLLLQRRKRLQSVADTVASASETVELDQTRVGRLSRMDAMQVQAMSLENRRRRELELRRIAAALSRISSDEYGYCIECGDEIAAERLRVDPAAPLCIQCANRSEQGGR